MTEGVSHGGRYGHHQLESALGLESGTVRLVPYDPRWAQLFDAAATELRAALGDRALDVLHVGSTAVPGLEAKPVLDILVAVPDFQDALASVPDIEAIGYVFRPLEEIPDRHYFHRKKGTLRTHHLSLAEPGSQHFRETVSFRDALCSRPELMRQYQTLKELLAERYPRDRDAYIEGKTAFVAWVLAGARPELAPRSTEVPT